MLLCLPIGGSKVDPAASSGGSINSQTRTATASINYDGDYGQNFDNAKRMRLVRQYNSAGLSQSWQGQPETMNGLSEMVLFTRRSRAEGTSCRQGRLSWTICR